MKMLFLIFMVFMISCTGSKNPAPPPAPSPGGSGGSTIGTSGGTCYTSLGFSNAGGLAGNVIPVNVGCGYTNEPCVSVTICVPGTSQCQTIPNVLLDTGSYGLRLFNCGLTLPLANAKSASNQNLAECVTYADGSSNWGPVALADVSLGSELASNIPIQIIDSSFGSIPNDCTAASVSPADMGANGILGVGLFAADCGDQCVTTVDNRNYFSCTGTNCQSTAVAIQSQVVNPVSLFSVDNNGVILTLPAVSGAGSSSLTGTLTFGIETSTNNGLGTASVLTTDSSGNIQTFFAGSAYSSFIDSGSNGLYFPQTSSLPFCSPDQGNSSFYCPPNPVTFQAFQIGSNSGHETISFTIGNADIMFGQGNLVLPELGGSLNGDFDWGLPFFFGRSVYVGIENQSVPNSTAVGPFWAY